jgi:heptosyltransferase III
MTKTIVMIHPGGLGDGLLAVPAMIRLRTRFPKHRLVVYAEDQVGKLLLACRIVDAWTSIQGRDCLDLFAGADASTGGQIWKWLEDCDLVIGWMKDLDGTLHKALKAAGVREVTVQSPFSAGLHAMHQSDRFLETIKESPSGGEECVSLTVAEPLLHLGRACLEARRLPVGQPIVVVHPGSGSVHKCVAPESLAAMVSALQSFGVTPVVLEGPADRDSVEGLLQVCAHQPIVLKDLDVLTLAGMLAQVQLFVGQDSGVTHMASLLRVQTIALFGPTDPDRWAPRGPHVTVVQGIPYLCRSEDDVGRCESKPCFQISPDHLSALCRIHLEKAAVR